MFLNYLALAMILIVLVALFYAFIYLHELPHTIAEQRHHPHAEAIYVACWLSLFTLHAIWPIVFIWAISKPKPAAGTTGGHAPEDVPAGTTPPDLKPVGVVAGEKGGDSDLARRLQLVEERLSKVESGSA